jgi:hypothetical protein
MVMENTNALRRKTEPALAHHGAANRSASCATRPSVDAAA